MKALQITTPGESRLVDIPEPTPGVDEALLRIHTVGYCGTDLNTFRGANPLVSYPRVPGHEIAATIEQLGPTASDDWRVGQQVLVFPYTECGHCSSCLAGRPNCCLKNQTLGVQRDGALCEWAVVPTKKLISSPGLSMAELALVEPLTVGAHALKRAATRPGEVVTVFGCGAIGLGVIAAAKELGAVVIAVDIDDEKLALAQACGATHVIHSGRTPLEQRVRELTDGHGPSVVIEAVGLPETFRTAVDIVSFAGRVVYVGYAKRPVEFETKWFVMKELDVLGSRNALRSDFDSVIQMLQRKRLPVQEIITKTVDLDAAGPALSDWADAPARVTKIHVSLDA